MKTGIISINAHTKVLNVASPLHSYAFQQYLAKHGYESVIIDYKPIYYCGFDPRHPLFHYIEHPYKNSARQDAALVKWRRLFYERESRYDKIEEFINKYYVRTDYCYSPETLDIKDPGCDCYICATDVIWKYNPHTGFDRGFFLASRMLEGKYKIAYAASRGAKGYTPEQEQEFLSLIEPFHHISVREKSLKTYMNSICDKPVTHVLDPVFLHDRDFYMNIAARPAKKGYVLVYIVMEKCRFVVETAVRYAQERGLEVIELGEDLENVHIPQGTEHPVLYDIGVEEWLGYMADAECVFTNSFHACALSIILHKEFFAGPRSGDKINSVLELFELEERRIYEDEENLAEKLTQKINFDRVDEIWNEQRKISEEFLLNALKEAEEYTSETSR